MTNPVIFPSDQKPRRVRLLLVDDMPQVRRDLRQLLELTDLFEVVGEVGDGLQAIHLALELSPDAVLMDLEMPGMDGYEATRRIKSQAPEVRIIILSVHAGPEERQRARASGADGFVAKGAHYQVLVDTILSKEGASNSFDPG